MASANMAGMRSCLSLLVPCLALACHGPSVAPPLHDPMLVHSVFFSLREDTPAKRAALIAACQQHLAPIEGIVHFAAGERDEGLVRDVNDRDFDVALLVVFRDRAAHDRYQPDPRHQRFIAENQDDWERVRVFDALVRTGAQP